MDVSKKAFHVICLLYLVSLYKNFVLSSFVLRKVNMETAVTFPRSFITRYITTQNVRTVMISKLPQHYKGTKCETAKNCHLGIGRQVEGFR